MIDVVIPTYNNLEELKACLEGFKKQSFSDFRVLICVDGSTDNTVEYFKFADYPFNYLILTHADKKNKGRNAARNLSLNHLKAAYLVMLDSDVVPDPYFLQEHLSFLEKERCISAGHIEFTNRKTNTWADYYQTRGKYKYRHKQVIPGYYLTTGNVAMKTDYFIRIGGQDAKIDQYGGGDTEFAYRLEQTFQLPVIYNRKACGTSEMNKTLDQALAQMYHFGKYNLHYLRDKHPEFESLFRFDLIMSKSLYARCVRWLIRSRFDLLIYRSLPLMPAIKRRLFIHFLVFSQMFKGYIGMKSSPYSSLKRRML